MCYYDLAISSSRLSNLSCKLLDHYLLSACMPHVTGHFCVCHVELWLLFHNFYPCVQCTQYPVPCHDFFRDKKFGFLDKIHFCHDFFRDKKFGFLDKIHFFIDIFLSLNFWICHEIEFFFVNEKIGLSRNRILCVNEKIGLSRNRFFFVTKSNLSKKFRDKIP